MVRDEVGRLMVEFVARLSRGENLAKEEYIQKYPHLAAELGPILDSLIDTCNNYRNVMVDSTGFVFAVGKKS